MAIGPRGTPLTKRELRLLEAVEARTDAFIRRNYAPESDIEVEIPLYRRIPQRLIPELERRFTEAGWKSVQIGEQLVHSESLWTDALADVLPGAGVLSEGWGIRLSR